jgi:hypothetical protein
MENEFYDLINTLVAVGFGAAAGYIVKLLLEE